MNDYEDEEQPGACTPYSAVNQLLSIDERFLVNRQAYLLIPKTIPRLSALLFLLNKEGLPYCLADERDSINKGKLLLSLKNLKSIHLLDEDKIQIEAGCTLEDVQSFLFEYNSELGLETLENPRQSIGNLILAGNPLGLKLRQLSLKDHLLAAELVKSDGTLLKWGVFGPPLQHLVYGIKEINALLVSLTFKIHPIPHARLYLSGSFEGWPVFDQLLNFTSSWERLDCLISSKKEEKGFVLGQISGLNEEMQAFQLSCPPALKVVKENKINLFKAYFNQQKVVYHPCSERPLQDFYAADYYWYQGLAQAGWLIYLESSEKIKISTPDHSLSLWKEKLQQALKL